MTWRLPPASSAHRRHARFLPLRGEVDAQFPRIPLRAHCVGATIPARQCQNCNARVLNAIIYVAEHECERRG